MDQIFQATVVQAAPVLLDTDAMIPKPGQLTRDAAASGAKLVIFPEACVGGYPKGLGFGAYLGSRSPGSPEGREEFRGYSVAAIDRPGPQASRYAGIDRRMITRGKYDLDVTGPYGRPDVVSLSVNTKPQSVVTFTTTTTEPASALEDMSDVRTDRT